MAAVEFALAAPFLLLLLLGMADLGLWLRGWSRLNRISAELADIITRRDRLDAGGLAAIVAAGQAMAGGIDVTGDQGATIISAVQGSGAANTMLWQKRTGSSRFASRFGKAGAAVVLPGQVLVRAGETVIIAELFTSGGPWVLGRRLFAGSAAPAVIAVHAIYHPRGNLLAAEPQ
ncbi:TadE/TadG family type IV pilus assembly protein [Roseomonas sp. USHLN139]|uniref:TadE/TadG family type IV pilus assembly protein n=1 Tax=Roseomonas sp. USHLN139 TaxID=3081298 RepID=UPI003B026AAE